ncbi:MAG: hypothetical protein R3F18_03330 [Lysobacterales bacterium]
MSAVSFATSASLPSNWAWVWVSVALVLSRLSRRASRSPLVFASEAESSWMEFSALSCLLFHRQGLGQLRQFQIQRGQSLVAAAERIRQHELTDGEDHQHEHQHHQQRAQGVDKARPEIDRTAATGGEGAHDGRL